MEKPNFIAGSETKFLEFISNINGEKTALVSHTDLDGLSAAKVTNKVINADILKFVDYVELNQALIDELHKENVQKLVITDLSIDHPDFIQNAEKHFEILIIDHHRFSQDYNSAKTTFMNAQGQCATYLAYYLFSKIQSITSLDWLVACATVADWMYFNSPEFMKETFEKYGDEFKLENGIIKKSGKFWDLQWKLVLALIYNKNNLHKAYESISEEFANIGDLGSHAEEVQQEINTAQEKFEQEKEEFTGGYFWEFNPRFKISSVISSIVSSNYKNKTILIARSGEKYYYISARRQDKGEDMSQFLKKLTKGLKESDAGGHIPAAGGNFLKEDKEEFKKRLKAL